MTFELRPEDEPQKAPQAGTTFHVPDTERTVGLELDERGRGCRRT